MEAIETDVLIVGGGSAGLRAALSAAEQNVKVTLVAKGAITRSGITPTAEFGILGQVDLNPEDSKEKLYEDVIRVGYQLSDQNLVNTYVRDIRKRIIELENMGCPFRKTHEGRFFQYIVPGEKYPRNLAIVGGGYSLLLALKREVLKHPNVSVFDDLMITRLLTYERRVIGATGYNFKGGDFCVFISKSTIICTGGYEQLWSVTDCPPGATGDGQALAYLAGANLIDMEMLLHYPSVAIWPRSVAGLIVPYEYLDSASFFGGEITNSNGKPVLDHPLPTREVACRLIEKEIKMGTPTPHGGVYWDITNSPKTEDEIKAIFKKSGDELHEYMKKVGNVDLIREPIEVAPSAHYQLGGIRINEKCETNIPGLFAAGEGTGNILGANRMAGNGLAPTQVFGALAGEYAAKYSRKKSNLKIPEDQVDEERMKIEEFFKTKNENVRPIEVKKEINKIMDKFVGVEITDKGLETAIDSLKQLRKKKVANLYVPKIDRYNLELFEAFEVLNMLKLAEIVAESALVRKESRGHFYRADYPKQDDNNWRKHTIARLKEGELFVSTSPIIEEPYIGD